MRPSVNFALLSTLLGAGGLVYYVHRSQTAERERMRKGPVRDIIRRQKQKELDQKLQSTTDD